MRCDKVRSSAPIMNVVFEARKIGNHLANATNSIVYFLGFNFLLQYIDTMINRKTCVAGAEE